MKQLSLQFLLLLPILSFSQSWELFPYEQKNYYQYQTGGETYYDFEYCDSIEITPNGTLHHLGMEYLNHAVDTCDIIINDIGDLGEFQYWVESGEIKSINSILVNNNIESSQIYDNYFEFKRDASIGESWMFSGIRFTCIDFQDNYEIVEGVFDSVRMFKIEYNIDGSFDDPFNDNFATWILSKNHGLIQYQIFHNLFNRNNIFHQLIGFENSSNSAGFQWFQANDFINIYTQGEIYKWEYNGESSWGPNFSWGRSFVRSIITSNNYSNGINNYTYDKEVLSYTYSNTNGEIDTIIYYEYGLQGSQNFISPYGFVKIPKGGYSNNGSAIWHYKQLENGRVEVDTWAHTIDIYDCYGISALDSGWRERFVTDIGIVYNWVGGYGNAYNESKLIGYSLEDDSTFGDYFPVSNNDLFSDINIKLYPNPAKDNISISLPETYKNETLKATIFDINGILLQEININNQSIDISHLNKGIFILRIQVKEKTIHLRFVKE